MIVNLTRLVTTHGMILNTGTLYRCFEDDTDLHEAADHRPLIRLEENFYRTALFLSVPAEDQKRGYSLRRAASALKWTAGSVRNVPVPVI